MSTPDSQGAPGGLQGFLRFEVLVSALNSLGTLWIIVLMVVINIDVVGRTAFRSPLPGVLELVSLSIVGIIFLQLGHTVRAGRITKSDSLFRRFAARWPRAAHVVQMLFHLAGAALFLVLFWASYPFLIDSWVSGEYEGIQGYVSYQVWPVRLVILIGSACAAIQYAIFAWGDFSIAMGWRMPAEEASSLGTELLR